MAFGMASARDGPVRLLTEGQDRQMTGAETSAASCDEEEIDMDWVFSLHGDYLSA